MKLVAVGEFKDVRLTPGSTSHLAALDQESRALVHQELERLRSLGPMRIYKELLAYKPISFVDGLKSIGFFVVGKVLGVVEILRKRIQLVAAIDLRWLKHRQAPQVFSMWKREARHKNYHWRAQLVVDEHGRMTLLQIVCKGDHMEAPNRKIKGWGYEVLWGCGLNIGEVVPEHNALGQIAHSACEAIAGLSSYRISVVSR